MLIYATCNVYFVCVLQRLYSSFLPSCRSFESSTPCYTSFKGPKRKTEYIGSEPSPVRPLDLYSYPCFIPFTLCEKKRKTEKI